MVFSRTILNQPTWLPSTRTLHVNSRSYWSGRSSTSLKGKFVAAKTVCAIPTQHSPCMNQWCKSNMPLLHSSRAWLICLCLFMRLHQDVEMHQCTVRTELCCVAYASMLTQLHAHGGYCLLDSTKYNLLSVDTLTM